MAKVAAAYLFGGIVLASDLPLPELPLLQDEDAPAPRVEVRVGVTPSTLSNSVEADPDCFVNSSQYLLHVRGVASYLVSRGSEIVVEPDKGAVALDVRAYLLGIVFSVLCHQRGLLPLHASAVSTPQGVIAFLAQSGQGKSSLAARLSHKGFPVVADDICLVDNGAEGVAEVIPAAPWLKLWRASLQQLGQAAEKLDRVFSEDDKYRLPIPGALGRQPIGKLVFLERSEEDRVLLEEISGIRALVLLMNLTHQAFLLDAMGRREEIFQRCGRILSQAKAYRLIRPWGFAHMDSTVERIESLLHEDPDPAKAALAPNGF